MRNEPHSIISFDAESNGVITKNKKSKFSEEDNTLFDCPVFLTLGAIK